MKNFLTIISSVLFCSLFFTPTEDAPLTTYLLWIIWVLGALFIVNVVWRELENWDKEDNKE